MPHPEIELARKNAQREIAASEQARAAHQRAYLEEYEFRGDGGDHTPTEAELTLITDAVEGLLADDKWLAAVVRLHQQRDLLRSLPT